MDVALSRRAAKAMSSRYMTDDLSFDERQQFVKAVRKAKDFDSLPEKYRKMIEQAEAKKKQS